VLHRAPHGPALADDFEIPYRRAITDAPAGPWNAGPFGEPARKEFERHSGHVLGRLARFDELAAVAAEPGRYVLTHGEPHQGNTIDTDEGVVLIDWDTALVAPPERDLWSLVAENPQTVDEYVERTGAVLRADALECYRLRWDLSEIAVYLSLFQAPHDENADTTTAWDGLCESLEH
jgi:spectinomycin phosphotransferase/16S rRNA (guanine(1405)-N(7))-methyltransferase